MNDNLLSVRNASGRHVSLLNCVTEESKRKYRCGEPGCSKSFTTSGHLARHKRIHTGEKNFPCLFPGCNSRFSRQDNMMQHYRTHMSPKSRRSPRKEAEERPKPRLHAHQRIRSDTIQMEPPLTIDQHLSKYRQYFSKKVIVDCPDPDLFYQHHPLTCSKQSHISSSLPCTLLHPNQPQSNRRSPPQRNQEEDIESSSEKGDNDLLQLAQIVSTLG